MNFMIRYIFIITLLLTFFYCVEGAITPVNISLWPPICLFKEADVYGLDVGIIATKSNKVYGIQFAPLWNRNAEELYGIQMSFINYQSNHLKGIQIGIFGNGIEAANTASILTLMWFTAAGGRLNDAEDSSASEYFPKSKEAPSLGTLNGIQIALWGNWVKWMAGLQVSCIINRTIQADGIQITGLINEAQYKLKGIQIAALNNGGQYSQGAQIGFLNSSGDLRGIQIGFLNISHDCKGVQIGVLNGCYKLKGIQIGALNFIRKPQIITPVMLGLNVGW